MESIIELKKRVCDAGRTAVNELIKIAEEEVIIDDQSVTISEDGIETKADKALDLSADKLTRAAQAKKIAIMDAFEILERVEREEANIAAAESGTENKGSFFAEGRAKKK